MPERRVLVVAKDLFFRARLEAVIRRAGAEPCRDGPADLAVVELGDDASVERVRTFVDEGRTVLAFGAHVHVARLRAAREAGAQAVPNSQVDVALRVLLRDYGG